MSLIRILAGSRKLLESVIGKYVPNGLFAEMQTRLTKQGLETIIQVYHLWPKNDMRENEPRGSL